MPADFAEGFGLQEFGAVGAAGAAAALAVEDLQIHPLLSSFFSCRRESLILLELKQLQYQIA